METFEDLDVRHEDGVLWITINRPDHGNMFRRRTCEELVAVFRRFRDQPAEMAAVLTGSGDRFFCLGGEKDDHSGYDHSVVLPIVDVYDLIDVTPKPVIAAVNGFAVGGGNVLHTVCDLTIAADHAVFRQVGPMVGSFDAGFGTSHLEDAIGTKRAKELWFLNRKYSAAEALAMGLINEVVPGVQLGERVRATAGELLERGPQALAALKTAFAARHGGVAGQARLAHDLLLTYYRHTEEATELGAAFDERRPPDRSRFNR